VRRMEGDCFSVAKRGSMYIRRWHFWLCWELHIYIYIYDIGGLRVNIEHCENVRSDVM